MTEVLCQLGCVQIRMPAKRATHNRLVKNLHTRNGKVFQGTRSNSSLIGLRLQSLFEESSENYPKNRLQVWHGARAAAEKRRKRNFYIQNGNVFLLNV